MKNKYLKLILIFTILTTIAFGISLIFFIMCFIPPLLRHNTYSLTYIKPLFYTFLGIGFALNIVTGVTILAVNFNYWDKTNRTIWGILVLLILFFIGGFIFYFKSLKLIQNTNNINNNLEN